MGTGIWAMHFIGMLSFSLPVPMSYDPAITAASVLPAIFASLIALSFLSLNTAWVDYGRTECADRKI